MARALVNVEGVAFGAVAAGTGNDLIHIFGFSDRFTDDEWTALFEGNVVKMDVGRCNGAYFFNGMGLGFDAQVAYENYHMENGGEVRKGSKSKYLRHILKTIFLYRERDAVITMGIARSVGSASSTPSGSGEGSPEGSSSPPGRSRMTACSIYAWRIRSPFPRDSGRSRR